MDYELVFWLAVHTLNTTIQPPISKGCFTVNGVPMNKLGFARSLDPKLDPDGDEEHKLSCR